MQNHVFRRGFIVVKASDKKQKPPEVRAVYVFMRGGESGIRTHGTGSPHAGFQDRYLQPLGHLSVVSTRIIANYDILV